jgi:hypothetical protein
LRRVISAQRSLAAIHLTHRATHAARLLVRMQRRTGNSAASDYQQYD